MQRKLENQADLIEAVLAAHNIAGRVWGGTVTPRFIRYDLTTSAGIRIKRVLDLKDEMAMSLGVPEVRLYRRNGAIRLEVPRRTPGLVRLLPLMRSMPGVPPLAAVLGVDEGGVPLLLRLPSPDVAHVLVAGSTGSGKTALLRSFALSLALHNPTRQCQLVLIDPKGRGFTPLRNLPHLMRPMVTEVKDASRVLQKLVAEMEQRDRLRRSSPAIVLMIDELADLRLVGGKIIEDTLTRLTQRGREAGIHVILSTQRPAATVVGSLVKANLPVRLVGAVGSPEDAKVATGIAGSGAERLQGRGDFLLISRGESMRLQSPYVSESDCERLTALIQQHPRQPMSQPLSLMPSHQG